MRKKVEQLGIRTTKRRLEILKAYTEKVEKNQTQVIEDFIDSLEVEVKGKEGYKGV